MGPRVIGDSTATTSSHGSNDDDDDDDDYSGGSSSSRGMAARGKRNTRRLRNQRRADTEYEELEAYQRQRRGDDRSGDQHDVGSWDKNTASHTDSMARTAKKKSSRRHHAKWNSESGTSREDNLSSRSKVAPLFQEHIHDPDYRSRGSSTRLRLRRETHPTQHDTGIYTTQSSHGPEQEQEQQQQLRVSIRLPSLYGAEWAQDHRVRHEQGLCQCPVSFERYLALDDEYGYPGDSDSIPDDEQRQETSGGDGSELEMSGALGGGGGGDFDLTGHYTSEGEDVDADHGRRPRNKGKGRDHVRHNHPAQQSELSGSTADDLIKVEEDDTDTELEAMIVPLKFDDGRRQQHSASSTAHTSRHPALSLRDQQNYNHEPSFMERTLGFMGTHSHDGPRPGPGPSPGMSVVSARSSRSSNGGRSQDYDGNQREQRFASRPQHNSSGISSTNTPQRRHGPRQHRAVNNSEFTRSQAHNSATCNARQHHFELSQGLRQSQAQRQRLLPLAGLPIGAGPEGHSHAGAFDRCLSHKRARRRRPSRDA